MRWTAFLQRHRNVLNPSFSRAMFNQIVQPKDPANHDHYFECLRRAGLPQ